LPKISDYTDSKGVHSEMGSYVLSSSSYHASFFFFHLILMLIPHASFKGQQFSFCIPSYIVLSLIMCMLLIYLLHPMNFILFFIQCIYASVNSVSSLYFVCESVYYHFWDQCYF